MCFWQNSGHQCYNQVLIKHMKNQNRKRKEKNTGNCHKLQRLWNTNSQVRFSAFCSFFMFIVGKLATSGDLLIDPIPETRNNMTRVSLLFRSVFVCLCVCHLKEKRSVICTLFSWPTKRPPKTSIGRHNVSIVCDRRWHGHQPPPVPVRISPERECVCTAWIGWRMEWWSMCLWVSCNFVGLKSRKAIFCDVQRRWYDNEATPNQPCRATTFEHTVYKMTIYLFSNDETNCYPCLKIMIEKRNL